MELPHLPSSLTSTDQCLFTSHLFRSFSLPPSLVTLTLVPTPFRLPAAGWTRTGLLRTKSLGTKGRSRRRPTVASRQSYACAQRRPGPPGGFPAAEHLPLGVPLLDHHQRGWPGTRTGRYSKGPHLKPDQCINRV